MDKLIYETGFGIISKSLVCNPNLSSEAKSLFAYFAAYAGNGDTAFPSVGLILYHMNWSKTKFYKYRNELEEKGYLQVEQIKEKGKFAHNIYRLIAIPIENTTKSPCPKNSDTVKRDTVFPDTENKDTNINSINKNSINKNSSFKKETSLDLIINEYTDNEELSEILKDFIKMRKSIKSPVTDRALKGILNKLDQLATNNENKIGILEQSIINSWKSVFPLKDQNKFSTTNSISKNSNNIQNSYKKGAGANVNNSFDCYSPDELEKILLESQKGKFD